MEKSLGGAAGIRLTSARKNAIVKPCVSDDSGGGHDERPGKNSAASPGAGGADRAGRGAAGGVLAPAWVAVDGLCRTDGLLGGVGHGQVLHALFAQPRRDGEADGFFCTAIISNDQICSQRIKPSFHTFH